MKVLVINSGSSSIKFRLYDMERERLLGDGLLERIGEPAGGNTYHIYSSPGDVEEYKENTPCPDHETGLQRVFDVLKNKVHIRPESSLSAIGHRVVHGGEAFQIPVQIDETVMEGIRKVSPLAPLHNPANLEGISATRRLCPEVPQVAVFDTAFFRNLPPCSGRYALPEVFYKDHHVRRFGFHGISHQHVSREAAVFLKKPFETLRLISLHLGNGASAAAVRDGNCIDTSMGMTPLEGLIMGTRSGDLDPSIPFHLARTLGMSFDEIETLLNHNSGMKGLCGVKDMREVRQLAEDGDESARLAIDMYCYRICKYVGAYHAILGGLDALVFTAGIGENDPSIRSTICEKLAALGISIDPMRNRNSTGETFQINHDESKASVLVVHTNEELEIARQTVSTLKQGETL